MSQSPPEPLDTLQRIYSEVGLDLQLSPLTSGAKPLFSVSIPGGEKAIEYWEKFRECVPQTGYWPLVMGSKTWDFQEYTDKEAQHALQQATQLSAAAYFQKNAKFLPRPEDEYDEWAEMAAEMGMDPPQYRPIQGYSSPYHVLSGEAFDRVSLVLFPSKLGWEAAAYLGFGGWNSCPEPAMQVVLHKYWYEKYGAEPVCMSADVLEMRVLNPPETEASALELAKEQCIYCDDIVFQGVMTLDNLKKTLLNGQIWYFWWD